MREKINFDKGWLFHKGDIDAPLPAQKGPVYTSAKTERMHVGPASRHYGSPMHDQFGDDMLMCSETWESVDLPHDYVIRGVPAEGGNPARGFFPCENAWYRKYFTLGREDVGRRITLLFEGVATRATVYLNGSLLAHNFCGYTSFEVDISDYVLFGEDNLLAVYVEMSGQEGWWYEGGGIYRHVYMIKTESVSVDLWGVYVAPRRITETSWDTKIETTVRCDRLSRAEVYVENTLLDADGKLVGKGDGYVSIGAKSTASVTCHISLSDPHLWDIDTPYLYTVETTLSVGGEQVDRYTTRTGFRTFSCDPNRGFLLNDREVKIKGVCAHGDFGLTGKAVPDNIYRYKVAMLKEMGANGYRTAHYPHSVETMDALDECGFIVMDETRWFDATEEGRAQLGMLVKRDRNRPSVFFWSIGNEEPHFETDVGRRIAATLAQEVRALDDTRPVIAAINSNPLHATIYDAVDVIGVNYSLHLHDATHETFPTMPMIASECCATGSTRGWYDPPFAPRQYLDAYDKFDLTKWFLGREITWKHIAERKWLMGGYQWAGFEHRGEASYPRLCSASGAIDLYLQKKDAFYQNQSHWIEDHPVLHLLPHWNFIGREGDPIRVFAYTNCPRAELFLNGVSMGERHIERYGHGEWTVPYEAGTLTAVGMDEAGHVVIRDERVTTGSAVRLALTPDVPVTCANGTDVALYTCTCLDSEGREVADATPFVTFHTNEYGTVLGTGSDHSDPIPPHIPARRMYAGRITVAVRVGNTPGPLRLYATAEGLTTAMAVQILN